MASEGNFNRLDGIMKFNLTKLLESIGRMPELNECKKKPLNINVTKSKQ